MSEPPRNVRGMEMVEAVSAERAMGFMLDALVPARLAANQGDARVAAGIADAFAFAAERPDVYTDLTGADGQRAAEQAVLLEVSLRVQLAPNRARDLAHTARVAARDLPELWRRALDGFAPFTLVEAAARALTALRPAIGATDAEVAASADAIALVDAQTAAWVMSVTPGAFRRRLRVPVDRLDPRAAAVRHVDAVSERRLVVDDPEDGMAWLHLLVPACEAIAIKRRATSTAKHLQKDARERRSRDQLRADLASAWLRGVGTPTEATVKVFVTVPASLVGGRVRGDHGECTMCGGTGRQAQAQIVGGPMLDPLTAQQLLLDAKSYRRLIVDPVSGAPVALDRRRYRPTKAQRDLLILRHGTCSRDGCDRLAVDADIDHILEWSRGGPTDIDNLRPLCPSDHATRHRTRIAFRTRPDGSTRVVTPTGAVSEEPPPF